MSPASPVSLSADSFRGITILVIGDLMLDRFVYGTVTRISPEAPVPILKIDHEKSMPGGAGNVIANLSGLSVKTRLAGIIGNDAAGRELSAMFDAMGTDTRFVHVAPSLPTIEKTRLIGNVQQMMRIDRETISADQVDAAIAIRQNGLKALDGADAVILSDYGKGCLTDEVLSSLIEEARRRDIPVLVDPKGADFTRYRGATVVTPNRQELATAYGRDVGIDDADIENAACAVLEKSGIAGMVATRSEKGMSVVQNDKTCHLRAEAREVFDVSGAGDTVIAVLAAALAAGADLTTAARLANRAAGVVVGRIGTAAIHSDDLFNPDQDEKLSYRGCSDAKTLIDGWKRQGLRVGFTNGCFDILHAGHVRYLAEARSHCDRLVVALNHDNSVKILKGPTRPVNPEADRAAVIAGLGSVDLVTLFGAETAGQDNTPCRIIDYFRPDIFFKGGDYREDQLPEASIVRAYGGDVKIMGLSEGRSTTGIIKKITG